MVVTLFSLMSRILIVWFVVYASKVSSRNKRILMYALAVWLIGAYGSVYNLWNLLEYIQ